MNNINKINISNNMNIINKLYRLDNLDIILNISEYLLKPAILIDGHYYDKNGNLKLNLNKKFINDQIKDVRIILSKKYCNKKNILFNIIDEINKFNIFWRNIKHNIYINSQYIYNNWTKSYTYITNDKSYSTYSELLYMTLSASSKNGYNIKNIEKLLDMFHHAMKIRTFQFHISYWGGYFTTYLENVNNDLNQFKVSNLLQYIKEEERIMNAFISDDE